MGIGLHRLISFPYQFLFMSGLFFLDLFLFSHPSLLCEMLFLKFLLLGCSRWFQQL